MTGWTEKQEIFFDQLSKQFGPYDFYHESPASKRSSIRFIKVIDPTAEGSIVELGCGRGEWVIKLAQLGYPVTGVDISQKSLDLLSVRVKEGGLPVNLIRGDAQGDIAAMVGNQSYSRVFCYNLLHHVYDIERVVKNMVKITKIGGKVIAYEPNPFNLWWFICPFFDHKFKWGIEKGLLRTPPSYIRKLFVREGLSNVKVIPWDFFPFISPDRVFRVTDGAHKIISLIPFVKYLSAVYVVEGYKL